MSSKKGKRLRRRPRYAPTDADQPLLERLRPNHRAILEAQGTYDEVAAALGIPSGTVKSRLNRARAALAILHSRQTEGAQHDADRNSQ